jgi:protoporphyrinogen/coproporphyrinogen III oxidase
VTAAGQRRLVSACTWSSAKWRHLAGEPAVLKAFAGRAGAPPPAVSDAELAQLVHAELAPALDLAGRPMQAHVEHFDTAIPQYAVGHLARIARIEEALPAGVEVAGAAYRGAGIAACVTSGQAAADRVLALPRPVPTPRSHR